MEANSLKLHLKTTVFENMNAIVQTDSPLIMTGATEVLKYTAVL